MILTFDLGTSVTKAVLWARDGARATGRSELETRYGAGGFVEQDPRSWWPSLVEAAAAARALEPGAFASVAAIGFSAARQSFATVDAKGEPNGPAILWSDRRAQSEASELDAGAVTSKIAWLARHEPDRLEKARWILSPRDLVVRLMTGAVATDLTLASASGLYDTKGSVVEKLAGGVSEKLPAPVPSATVVGELLRGPATELGLEAGIPVVIGAGDRPCEVLGSGASERRAMVSWGTTANVSIPTAVFPEEPPSGLSLTSGALGGWLVEGGVAAAGSLVAWFAGVTGSDPVELLREAGCAPAGSRGVTATAWLGGSRAPWWNDLARASFTGLGPDATRGDLARSLVEAVAWDLLRCLEVAEATCAMPEELALAGSGAETETWAAILTGVTGLPAIRGLGELCASAGAAIVVSSATGDPLRLEEIAPDPQRIEPDPANVEAYAKLRHRSEEAVSAVMGLAGEPT